jgi:hypothetical protein
VKNKEWGVIRGLIVRAYIVLSHELASKELISGLFMVE